MKNKIIIIHGWGIWHVEMGKKYMQDFVAKPEGEKLLEKPKGRWNGNENGS